jgi:hypothetical protein
MPTDFEQEHPPESHVSESSRPGKRAWQSPVCRDIELPGLTQDGGTNGSDNDASFS